MDPVTRKEMFLAKAGGQDVTTPTPVTREEIFLNEIAKGGGGSGGGVLVVHDVDGTLDKTWQEIHDAFVAGRVLIDNGRYQNVAIGVGNNKGDFSVTFAAQQNLYPGQYTTNAASGYPTNA